METIAPIITALTTAISILAVLWIYRQTKRVDSVHFVTGIGVVLYTLYHFYACGILGTVNPIHGTITGIFISSMAWINAYCSTCNPNSSFINIGVCRRHKPDLKLFKTDEDRRKIESHTVFKGIAKTHR